MISVKDIAFSYDKSKEEIFKGYTFSLSKGEILAILGPNGTGKTTLIKTLLNILPLNKGTIEIKGDCSYVPQETLSPFDYSVLEVVLMGASSKNSFFAIPTRDDYIKTKEVLEQLDILDLSDKSFSYLSGGQKQMVLIARALASNPDIIILDEPTSALDYYNQKKVLNTILKVSEQGKVVIFSTHCPMQALYTSHKVLLVQKYQKSIFGTSKDILTQENLSNLYQIQINCYKIENNDIIIPIYSK